MRRPTDVLRDEHRVILRALDALDAAGPRLGTGPALPAGWWDRALEFLRAFADRNHHAKEEQALFPALVAAGVPSDQGPVGVMLAEHSLGRALVHDMAEGGATERASATRQYVALLRDHIAKEDGVLWPLAESVLEEPAVREVARAFEALEAEQGRGASLADAEALVKELELLLA